MNWTYPALMAAAIATGLCVSYWTPKPAGLRSRQRAALLLGAFCGAMIGAKLPFVLADWKGLLSGMAWFENGKTIVFGLVGGYFGVELAKWALRIEVKTGDSFAAPVAATIAVGRLACFSAGCCYGTPTDLPWGVNFGDGVARHPTQLYEFAFHLLCVVLLAPLRAAGYFRGQLIKLYILAYLAFRFVTEYIRPEPRLWLELTAYQYATLGLMPIFVWLWWRDRSQASRNVVASPGRALHNHDQA